jgi:cytochrome c oxidase cbb3-type subunit 3
MARRRWIGLTAVLLIAAAAILLSRHLHNVRLETQLLRTDPDVVAHDSQLVRFAVEKARPLYTAHCAACHGVDMTGSTAQGAPDLTDRTWLYGDGSVFTIERTVLYGARSGLSKSHDVSDMPAFGTRGLLTPTEIQEVVQYLLALSGRRHQNEAARAGREVYLGKGGCGDCHGGDARGNSDYGAPDLTANVWNSGGDPRALYDAVYFGEHRIMPGWFGTLPLGDIRALAVYVYAASHR